MVGLIYPNETLQETRHAGATTPDPSLFGSCCRVSTRTVYLWWMGRKRFWSSVELRALGGRKVSCLWHCCCPSFSYSFLLLAVHLGDRCHHSIEYATVQPRLSCLETTPFCQTNRIFACLERTTDAVTCPTCRFWVLERAKMRRAGSKLWLACLV